MHLSYYTILDLVGGGDNSVCATVAFAESVRFCAEACGVPAAAYAVVVTALLRLVFLPAAQRLAIRALIPDEDRRNRHESFIVVRGKNDAVPAHAFSVSPLPASASKREDIATEWVRFQLVNGAYHALAERSWQASELSLSLAREFKAPVHA